MNKTLLRTDKNGTKYWGCKDKCFKCQGTGYVQYFAYHDNGICYDCDGTGVVQWEEKEYTPEYEAKLKEQREKRQAKKLEKLMAQAAGHNAEFFEKNGFTAEGKTYFVLGNTFDIKDELKAQGAKWDSISKHWHMAVKPEGLDVECFELCVDDMYAKDYAGMYHWDSNLRCDWDDPKYYVNRLKTAEDSIKARTSTSEHVGKVGEKLEVVVTYTHTAQWSNNYSYGYWTEDVTNLHTFKDEQGNIFVWKTELFIDADYGTKMLLKGTIKEHSEYKGIKQTVLTRCKLKEVK